MIIAIDGPAGSGKSTVAKILAKQLNFVYIDSGAAYRAVSYYFIKNNLDFHNDKEVDEALKNINITYTQDGYVILNEEVLKDEIRTTEVSALVSEVSENRKIREKLTQFLREFAGVNSVVMDGRDIGTVVFPMAEFKFYFEADTIIRATRRLLEQRKELTQNNIDMMMETILRRDTNDKNRTLAPLKKASDSIVVETGNMSIEDVVKRLLVNIRGI